MHDSEKSRLLIRQTDGAVSHATLAEIERANQLQSAEDEIARLKRWKSEQLQVEAWWREIDEYVRPHRDARVGDKVSATALKWLKERDAFLVELFTLRNQVELLRQAKGVQS